MTIGSRSKHSQADSHCTGPGTGTGQETACTLHIVVQVMVQGIGENYGLVPDLVVKWVYNPLWLILTARDQDRDRDWEMMGFCIMLCTVHTTQGQGQVHGTIVFYCAHSVPCPGPGPVQYVCAFTPRSCSQSLSLSLCSVSYIAQYRNPSFPVPVLFSVDKD